MKLVTVKLLKVCINAISRTNNFRSLYDKWVTETWVSVTLFFLFFKFFFKKLYEKVAYVKKYLYFCK